MRYYKKSIKRRARVLDANLLQQVRGGSPNAADNAATGGGPDDGDVNGGKAPNQTVSTAGGATMTGWITSAPISFP